jgi:trehalose 6-phosphate synthase
MQVSQPVVGPARAASVARDVAPDPSSVSSRRRPVRRRKARRAAAGQGRSGRLVVVANRLPVRRVGRRGATWELSTGGLVTALRPVLKERGGSWVGWSGSGGRAPSPFEYEGLRLRPVPLSEAEVTSFYEGFANSTLWPLYHDAIRTPGFHRRQWHPFVEINRRFARATARVARPRDLIWVHDYHLQLVPFMIRELRPRARIGFFLHIPFPPDELFAWLPWRTWILNGLLGADVVGFQTPSDAQNFARVARRYTTAEGTDSELQFHGRRVRVGAFPISIDFQGFEELAEDPAVIRLAQTYRKNMLSQRKVVLSVDRLDYTKGIDARLQAYEELLRRRVVTVDDCVLVQIAVPTRENVREYREVRDEVERTVGRINGQFSQPGRVAVHYFRRSVPRHDLVAYYRAADVMLVTPLRDGMNLVAKEYVASRVDNTGVLVLSEFAGAARELRRALLVNPRDIDGLAATIAQALRMPREESRRRMAVLRMIVRRADVFHWADEFLSTLTP